MLILVTVEYVFLWKTVTILPAATNTSARCQWSSQYTIYMFCSHLIDIIIRDVMVSQDALTMCDGCLLSFVADLNRDTSGLMDGSGIINPLILFPDQRAHTCLLRVRHSLTSATYAMEIVGANLQCRQGIMDVFLKNGCASTGHMGLLFTECKGRPVTTQMDGTTLCTYICTPSTESDTTFISLRK